MKIKITTLLMMVLFAISAEAQTTFIGQTATWSWKDTTAYPTNWTATSYDDSHWSSNSGIFGYGGIGATITTTISASPTTLFRREFNLTGTNYGSLDLNLLCDDGVVVYLNGNVILSDNMPGTVNFNTYASSAVAGGDEGDYDGFSYTISPGDLVVGTNVIAVELHNASATSSDAGFDLEVIGYPPSAYVVNSGDSWYYWDQGSEPTGTWEDDTNYAVGSWSSGNSLLGYGSIDGRTVATTVSYGPSSTNKYPTTYFRKNFTISDTSSVNYLDIDYVRDDGVIIYVNGVEVIRDGLASGTIGYSDYANQTIGGSDEGAWQNAIVVPTVLHQGQNVIAAEVHQTNATSSDVAFDLRFETLDQVNPSVTRGPYIQNTTDTSAIVRWRTDIPVPSAVKFGTTHGTYTTTVDSTGSTSRHEIVITGLTPDTKYFYHLSTNGTDTVGRHDNTYFFKTAPTPGDNSGTVGFWILGDQGQVGTGQAGVHQEFLATGFRDSMDLILMLGDNAYNDGTDNEFQYQLFDTRLDSVLRNTPMYSCVGNHEVRYVTAHSISTPESTPYYEVYNCPANGEGGGVASNTESYFSFDYGNVHFISINAEEEDLDSNTSTMWSWCESDLQQNTADWTVAIVHQGPYTKGSHNSDTEAEHVDFRENFVPLFERYGVDLTASGHSHSYERSKLVKGHFGTSGTYSSATHDVDGGFGRMPGSGSLTNDCAYEKTTVGPTAGDGAIYCTAGSSSKSGSYAVNHPVMRVNHNTKGSVYVEVNKNKLSWWYIEEDGDTADYFQIFKDIEYDSTHILTDSTVTLEASWPEGPYVWSTGATTRSITVTLGEDSMFTVQNLAGPSPCMADTFNVDFPSIVRYPFSEVDTTGMSSLDADGSSVILADAHTSPDANGWYHYYNAQDSNALLFAVRNSLSGGNTTNIDAVIDYVELRKAGIYGRIEQGTDSFFAVMPVDWNVVTLAQPNGGMDIRFYFDPADLAAFTTVMDSIAATNTDLVSSRAWFKANQGGGVSFTNDDITVDSVNNYTDLTGLLAAAPNYSTGVGSTDGTPWVDRGNGKNYVQFNGLTTFSGGSLSQSLYDPTPVPVTWLAFNASWIGSDAHLVWQTASEQNNKHFLVQRKLDNGAWETIETIAAEGNSNSVQTYQSVDFNAATLRGTSVFYRIVQEDFNGKASESLVRSLSLSDMNIVNIFPNPATSILNIELSADMLGADRIQFTLFNLDGKMVKEMNIEADDRIQVDINDIAAGVYVATVSSNNRLHTFRLVKE